MRERTETKEYKVEEVKEGTIPSIPKKLDLRHLEKSNGKILTDEEIHDKKVKLSETNHAVQSFTKGDVHGFIIRIKEKDQDQYYVTYENSPLGKGGYGEVILAQHIGTLNDHDFGSGKFYAVKNQTFRNMLPEKQEERAYFAEREHENLKKIRQSLGVVSAGKTYHSMVMELASGIEMAKMKNPKNPSLEISASRRLEIAYNAAEVISDIHQNGLLHRDIKDENLMVDPVTGKVKPVDFGAAIEAKDPKLGGSDGKIIGTHGFLAPEVSKKDGNFGQFNEKSEVFALGKTLGNLFGLTQKLNYLSTFRNEDKRWSDSIIIVDEDSRQFLKNTQLPDPTIKKMILQLLKEMTDNDPAKRPPMDDVKSRLKNIMDNQLSVFAKFNNLGILNIEEYKGLEPKERMDLINALKNCDEICFVHTGSQPISELELGKLKRELEDAGVPVGERRFHNHSIDNIVRQIPELKSFNANQRMDIPIYVTKDEKSAEQFQNSSVGAIVANNALSEKDYQKQINSHYKKQLITDKHIEMIEDELRKNIQYLEKKYKEANPNAIRRIAYINDYLGKLNQRKDTLTYSTLFKELKDLQDKMQSSGTLSSKLKIDSTAAKNIGHLREEIKKESKGQLDTRAARRRLR